MFLSSRRQKVLFGEHKTARDDECLRNILVVLTLYNKTVNNSELILR